MQIRLAAPLQSDSIVDGAGIRTVIWTQGCKHACKECQNPETHSFDGGALFEIEDIKRKIDTLICQDGLTFSGGDPMYQPEACNEIAAYAKTKGLNIWCYTGFTYEQLLKMAKTNKAYMDFLENIDVLVDGPFIVSQKSYDVLFRGSTNQRLIDVVKSLKTGNVELVTKYDNSKIKNEKKECIFI